MTPARLLTSLVLLGTVACGLLTEPQVDGPYASLHVGGTVRDLGGAPVPGAAIDVRATDLTSCTTRTAVSVPTTSDDAGTFVTSVGTWNRPFDACIWIAVLPLATSNVAPDTILVRPARLGNQSDTLKLAIVLPPRANGAAAARLSAPSR